MPHRLERHRDLGQRGDAEVPLVEAGEEHAHALRLIENGRQVAGERGMLSADGGHDVAG